MTLPGPALQFLVLLLTILIPLSAPISAAAIGQLHGASLAAEAPRKQGGWEQTLGAGLAGTPTSITFPVSFTRGSVYGPRFLFSLDACADAQYEQCERRTWGPWDAQLDPEPQAGVTADTTVTITLTGDSVILDPAKYYRISLTLSLFMGGPGDGSFLPYGFPDDRFSGGSTTAAGLADLAFLIEGASKEQQDPLPEPTPTPAPGPLPEQISSVMFLPGLKGSRLYKPSSSCEFVGISCALQLWLPLADGLVPSLFLDTNGQGNPAIFAQERDLIYGAFGQEFYSTLAQKFDDASRDGTYGAGWQWLPAAYDWRLASEQIARSGVQTGERISYDRLPDESPGYLLSELQTLASSSPTGRVTIVAHSYGGIVAWRLIEALGVAASTVIDRLILVGVPQHGSPRALGALLFGDREAIPGFKFLPNTILSEKNARRFAQTSPAAYELLPSAEYFGSQPATPLLTFDDAFPTERDRYGAAIDSIHELEAYATAREGGRQDPGIDDLSRPAILPEAMTDFMGRRPQRTHGGIEVHQIGGWGESTVTGYHLYGRPRYLFGAPIGTARGFTISFSPVGDGVVPIESAIDDSLTGTMKYWVNLAEARRDDRRFGHGDLLESPQVLATIENILFGSTNLPRGVTRELPFADSALDRIRITLGSPARLVATDAEGRRTGETEEGLVAEEIPDSWYAPIGSHAVLELEPDQVYRIEAIGEEAGFISLSVDHLEAGAITDSSSVLDIPVSSSTTVSFSMEPGDASPGHILLDSTGDGQTDEYMPWTAGESRPYRPVSSDPVTSSTVIENHIDHHTHVSVARSEAPPLPAPSLSPINLHELPAAPVTPPRTYPAAAHDAAEAKTATTVASTVQRHASENDALAASLDSRSSSSATTLEVSQPQTCELWWWSALRWIAAAVSWVLSPITMLLQSSVPADRLSAN